MKIVLRLVVALFFPVISLCGYLAFDFWNANRMARMGEGDGISVGEYLSGWVSFAGAVSKGDDPAAAASSAMPQGLAAMLPKPPAGWTSRPTTPADVDSYITAEADGDAVHYARAVASERSGKGMEQARLTYENGDRRVVFELLRYPDFVFTSFAAMQIKMELSMAGPQFGARSFMTVRGMEIMEDQLPEGVGLRYFVGDVSDQIWVRALAPRDMTDEELLPFFQTLHVPAMNANVVEKVNGMGEVPVIVLASVIDAETRAAMEAEFAAEEARLAEERAARDAELAAQAEAEAKAEAERAEGIETDAESGVKVRKGTGEGGTAGFADEGCTLQGSRKVCGGVKAPEVPAEAD